MICASVGSGGFGTEYRYRAPEGGLSGAYLPVDLAGNAASLGACVLRASSVAELDAALAEARRMDRTVVVHVEADREARVGSYECWWDVPVAEVAEDAAVREARQAYERNRLAERWYL